MKLSINILTLHIVSKAQIIAYRDMYLFFFFGPRLPEGTDNCTVPSGRSIYTRSESGIGHSSSESERFHTLCIPIHSPG